MNWTQALLDALAFFAGGLAAGLGGVLVQIGIDRSKSRAMRRALAAEIRENIGRLGGAHVTQIPTSRVVRSAWDEARALTLPDETFDAIADGYRFAEGAMRMAEVLLTRSVSTTFVLNKSAETQHRDTITSLIILEAQKGVDAFVVGLAALTSGRKPRVPSSRAHVDEQTPKQPH